MLWPPWYSTTNNIATFDPAVLQHQQPGGHQSGHRPDRQRPALQRHRPARRRLPQRRRATSRSTTTRRCKALFVGAPRGPRPRRTRTSSSRASACPTRRTRRRSSGPAPASSTTASRSTTRCCSAATRRSSRRSASATARSTTPAASAAPASLPFGMTGHGSGVQAPDRLHVLGRRAARAAARASSSTRPTSDAGAATCSASATSTSCRPAPSRRTPASTPTALRPYKGYGVIRLSENAGRSTYNSLQLSADRRYRNGFKFGAAYTLGKSEDNAQRQARRAVQHLRRHGLLGPLELRPPPRVQLLLHLRPAVLRKEQQTLTGTRARRLADLRLDVHAHRHAAVGHARRRHRPASATPFAQPWNLVGDPTRTRNGQFSQGSGTPTRTSGSTRRRSRGRPPARSATRRATTSTTRGSISGTSRSSRTSRVKGQQSSSSGRRSSTSSTTRT